MGRASQQGIRISPGDSYVSFTAFEGLTKSNYHRPCQFTYGPASVSLQVICNRCVCVGRGGGSCDFKLVKISDASQSLVSPTPPISPLLPSRSSLLKTVMQDVPYKP